MNTSASIETLRAEFEMAANAQAGNDAEGFFGYAAAFKWESEEDLAGGLTDVQKSFLGTKLMRLVDDVPDRLPSGVDLKALDTSPTEAAGLADGELRLTLGSASQAIDADITRALQDGHLVLRLAPKDAPPVATRKAGAILVVDMQNREALVVYGRKGPAPVSFECKVTKMISYEFEESLSEEEYPSVEAAEIPLLGDVHLDIGSNRTFSNADAKHEGEDYVMNVTKTGTAVEIAAKGPSLFRGKIVVDGTKGKVYGDRDGDGEPNEAAELDCSRM